MEEDILDVFGELSKEHVKSSIPSDTKYERIILWSSNSAKIFCTVSSIFNALLQRIIKSGGHYKFGTSIVSQFIVNVKLKCVASKKDFVQLYPLEYHSLVSILDINPGCFPKISAFKASVTISNVIELIKLNLTENPVQTLCILTHFPDWLPHVNR